MKIPQRLRAAAVFTTFLLIACELFAQGTSGAPTTAGSGTTSSSSSSGSTINTALCTGKFPNLVSDICWSCVFPINLAGAAINIADNTGEDYQSRTSNSPICGCTSPLLAGIPVSFWEMVYMTDITNIPGCFPLLGGITISTGLNAMQYGAESEEVKGTSFQQINEYINPVMYLMGAIMDWNCMDTRGFDIPWVSFADPLHNNDSWAMVATPYAYPFASLTTIVAGSVDAVAADVGFPLPELFWVAGAWGPIFPITGNVSARLSREQMARLQTVRLFAELHALGTQYSAAGDGAMCGYVPELVLDKREYKISRLLPFSEPKTFGHCCEPIGRSTILTESGTQAPTTSFKDFGYAIFRKRDCCSGILTPASAN